MAHPVFLIGAPRSGTTWLNVILGKRPDIAAGPESYIFEIINQIIVTAEHRYENGEGILRHYISRAELSKICAGFFHDVFESHVGNKTYFAEKTPMHILYLQLMHEIFPHAKIIHIIRDGRDVVYSLIQARQERERYSLPDTIPRCIKEWSKIEKVLQFRNSHGDIYAEIRYEDMVKDLKSELIRLFESLHIPLSDKVLRAMCGAAAKLQYPSRMTKDYGFTGKWKALFSQEDISYFKATAGHLLIELGYEQSDDW